MRIRFAAREDLEKIVEIYNQAVITKRATADLDPVTIEERQKWFEDHKPYDFPIYVAVEDNKVVGWCSLSPYRPGRRALRENAEISYYVDYSNHGKGIGSELIKHAIDDCERLGIKNLFTYLLEVNEKSIGLLLKFGFEKWGYMPNAVDLEDLRCGHCMYGKNL